MGKGASARWRKGEEAKAKLAFQRAQSWARGESVREYRPAAAGAVLGSVSAGGETTLAKTGRPSTGNGRKKN